MYNKNTCTNFLREIELKIYYMIIHLWILMSFFYRDYNVEPSNGK